MDKSEKKQVKMENAKGFATNLLALCAASVCGYAVYGIFPDTKSERVKGEISACIAASRHPGVTVQATTAEFFKRYRSRFNTNILSTGPDVNNPEATTTSYASVWTVRQDDGSAFSTNSEFERSYTEMKTPITQAELFRLLLGAEDKNVDVTLNDGAALQSALTKTQRNVIVQFDKGSPSEYKFSFALNPASDWDNRRIVVQADAVRGVIVAHAVQGRQNHIPPTALTKAMDDAVACHQTTIQRNYAAEQAASEAGRAAAAQRDLSLKVRSEAINNTLACVEKVPGVVLAHWIDGAIAASFNLRSDSSEGYFKVPVMKAKAPSVSYSFREAELLSPHRFMERLGKDGEKCQPFKGTLFFKCLNTIPNAQTYGLTIDKSAPPNSNIAFWRHGDDSSYELKLEGEGEPVIQALTPRRVRDIEPVAARPDVRNIVTQAQACVALGIAKVPEL